MTNSHDLLLIKSSKYQRNAVYKCKLERKRIVKETQIDLHFHLPLILILQSPIFFHEELKFFLSTTFNFSQFYEHII